MEQRQLYLCYLMQSSQRSHRVGLITSFESQEDPLPEEQAAHRRGKVSTLDLCFSYCLPLRPEPRSTRDFCKLGGDGSGALWEV